MWRSYFFFSRCYFLPSSHTSEAQAVDCLLIQRSNFNITREQINGKSSYQITLWFSGFYFSSSLLFSNPPPPTPVSLWIPRHLHPPSLHHFPRLTFPLAISAFPTSANVFNLSILNLLLNLLSSQPKQTLHCIQYYARTEWSNQTTASFLFFSGRVNSTQVMVLPIQELFAFSSAWRRRGLNY